MIDWLDIFSGAAGAFVGAVFLFALMKGESK